MKRFALVIIAILVTFTTLACRGEEESPNASLRNIEFEQNTVRFDLRVNDVDEVIEELEVRLVADGVVLARIKDMLELHETTEDLYFEHLDTDQDYTIEVIMTWLDDEEKKTETVDTHDFLIERVYEAPTAEISNVRPGIDTVTFDFLLNDKDGAVTGLSVVLYDEEDTVLFQLSPPDDGVGLGENEDVVFDDLAPSATYTIRIVINDYDGYKTYISVVLAEATFTTDTD